MKIIIIIISVVIVSGLLVGTFSTDKLTRFCLFTPLKVLIVSFALTALLWVISGFVFEDTVSGIYFEVRRKDLFFYPFFICIMYALASYSIFLCKVPVVRNNRSLTFLSFFIIPLVFVLILSFRNGADTQVLHTLYFYIAFAIPQSYFYNSFLNKQAKGEWR